MPPTFVLEWLRPEYQGRFDELETQTQAAERLGISLPMLRSYVARYPEKYPEVAAREGRLTYRAKVEVDAFLVWLNERDRIRTPAEAAAGEVLRLTKSLDAAQTREARLGRQYEEAKRNTARIATDLRVQQERAKLLAVADRAKK